MGSYNFGFSVCFLGFFNMSYLVLDNASIAVVIYIGWINTLFKFSNESILLILNSFL